MTKIVLTEDQSSTISKVSYHRRKMIVAFKSGHQYLYHNVPRAVFDEWAETIKSGGSAGKWFHVMVKDQYDCERVHT